MCVLFATVETMGAKQRLNSMLSDDEMRLHLAQGNILVFEGLDRRWQEVEQQVERLGFGDAYLVLRAEGVRGTITKVTPAAN